MLKERAIELFGHGYVTRTEPFDSKNFPETHPLSPLVRKFEQENQYGTLADRIAVFDIDWPVVVEVLSRPNKYGIHSTAQAALDKEIAPRGKGDESFVFSSLSHARWQTKWAYGELSAWNILPTHSYKGDERKFRRERALVMTKMIDGIKEMKPLVTRELPAEINIPEPYPVGTKIYGVHKSCNRDGENCRIITTEDVVQELIGPSLPEGGKFHSYGTHYPRYSFGENRQGLSHKDIFSKAVEGAVYTADPVVAEELRAKYQTALDLKTQAEAAHRAIWTPPASAPRAGDGVMG